MTGHVRGTSVQSIHYAYWVATCVAYLWIANRGPRAEGSSWRAAGRELCWRIWEENVNKIVVLAEGLPPAAVTVTALIIIIIIIIITIIIYCNSVVTRLQ
jgi:hypothetical protein